MQTVGDKTLISGLCWYAWPVQATNYGRWCRWWLQSNRSRTSCSRQRTSCLVVSSVRPVLEDTKKGFLGPAVTINCFANWHFSLSHNYQSPVAMHTLSNRLHFPSCAIDQYAKWSKFPKIINAKTCTSNMYFVRTRNAVIYIIGISKISNYLFLKYFSISSVIVANCFISVFLFDFYFILFLYRRRGHISLVINSVLVILNAVEFLLT